MEGSKEERVRKGRARQIPNTEEARAPAETGSWNLRKMALKERKALLYFEAL